MRVIIHAQDQWQFLTALYPLFKQALPRTEVLSERERSDLRVFNAVKSIRHNILSIPLQIQHVQLHQDLEEASLDKFRLALHSLLSMFERLVADDVYHYARDNAESVAPQHQWLRASYPRLWILRRLLRSSRIDLTDTQTAGNHGESWLGTDNDEYSTDLLLELARFISFHGSRTVLDYQYLSNQILYFHSEVQEVFKEPLTVADGNIGNAALLREDEIQFIRRAHHLNLSSSSLFGFLNESIVCSRPHRARVHLSGFLDPGLCIDLLLTSCENDSWVCTKCKLTPRRPKIFDTFGHDNFLKSRVEPQVSEMIHLAFDSHGIWRDDVQESTVDEIDVPDSLLTLEELVIPASSALVDATDVGDFEPEDEKIIQLLLASSLFHLNASHWLRGGLDIDRIMIFGNSPSHDLLKRWRPYITCSLKNNLEVEETEDEDILSFGLLVLEMEAKRRVKPIDQDMDWITGLPSKDSMLKRALVDWKRKLDDSYQQIGKACLNFRELAEKSHHPQLPENMKRTAAIYRYILAPLHQLITQRYCGTTLLFKGFPQPTKSSQLQMWPLTQYGWGSPPVLFDDSKPGSTWHDPIKISYATEFMQSIRPFVDMIASLSDTCKEPDPWETWKTKKIRMAIIDTGIDVENDIIIQTALECGSIQECRNFTDNKEDCQDSHGHGTHIARLMLDLAPGAELYIAKVSDGKTLEVSALSRIAEAIKWAHKTIKADIISLSLGLEPDNRNVEVDKAISSAVSDNTIFFAAAANSGGNKPRAYPANRRSGIICIHASDGRGNDGGISPSPEARKSNFSTLGISIESKWKGEKVLKSGTSFATPIAAALAANMLEFARYKCSLDEYEQQRLHSYDGMEAVLHLMAKERQGYDYIMPLHLWSSKNEMDVIQKLVNIARS